MIKSTTTNTLTFDTAGSPPYVANAYMQLPVPLRLSSVLISATIPINVRVNGNQDDQSVIFSGKTVHVSGDVGEITSIEVGGSATFTVTFVLVE